MKTLIFSLLLLCVGQAHARSTSLKTLNCGTPRKASGEPGVKSYSVSILLPDSSEPTPQFYLVIESQNPGDQTVTEPLVNKGKDTSGWWLYSGVNSIGAVRSDFYEASLSFSDGDKLNLLCR